MPQYAVPAPEGVVQLWRVVRNSVYINRHGAEPYEVSDILIAISGQRRVWHDKPKCVATVIPPGRERNVRLRVRIHHRILCPASLSICLLSVEFLSRDIDEISAYRRRPRSTRRRYVLRFASWSRGHLFCRSGEMVCPDFSRSPQEADTRE